MLSIIGKQSLPNKMNFANKRLNILRDSVKIQYFEELLLSLGLTSPSSGIFEVKTAEIQQVIKDTFFQIDEFDQKLKFE